LLHGKIYVFIFWHIAEAYLRGHGIKKSKSNALLLYKQIFPQVAKYAKHGDSQSMLILGNILNSKRSYIKAKDKQALKYYTNSANAGNAEALGWVGMMYLHGQGVKKDVNEAKLYFELAKEKGDTWSMNRYVGLN